MSMSKRDFVALADALRPIEAESNRTAARDTSGRYSYPADAVLSALLRFCRDRNQRFDADRWLAYLRGECGPNGGKR